MVKQSKLKEKERNEQKSEMEQKRLEWELKREKVQQVSWNVMEECKF